jgi:hypothetical protein
MPLVNLLCELFFLLDIIHFFRTKKSYIIILN